ncbi:hypothetical protein [Mycolicibacterium sarraceniae]|uniref:hypothetical protein n=1 Tax=Mycolicibacterium sarraceniae TaxID=1534348 RepID=UPI0015D1BC7E|nr:hypothetical protein [Mycolicibacterium sarraceniae]
MPAELRSPLLPILTGDTTERSSWRTRLLMRVSVPTGAGATVTRRHIAGRRDAAKR